MTAQLKPWTFPYCPKPEDKTIAWDELNRLDCLAAMDGCKQDAQHHAEGDVLTHTMMVCQALVGLKSWQELDELARNVLFVAALLHDVAKPATTKVDSYGKISSLKHTRVGASMVRELLWMRKDFAFPPFEAREQIVKLVRYSGLPLWFLEKDDPVKAVLRASISVNLHWLSILAEADVQGRSCADQSELLERVQMFVEFCGENHCLSGPKSFASDHSRFTYFHSESRAPERHVYDDTKSKVTILSGLPGAGKDTFVKEECKGLPVISLDAIRVLLDVEPEDKQAKVIARAKEQAIGYLKAGQDFAWNATNVSGSLRSSLIAWMQPYKPRIRIVYLEAPSFELLKQRNRERSKPVPESVLMKLLHRLELPDLSEAHELLTRLR